MNVVIYSRVSSQSARQSTERQVVDLERFAAGRGYEVTAVFEEKISGRKGDPLSRSYRVNLPSSLTMNLSTP